MEIPGLNPASRQPITPQQQGVPDLILDVPRRGQQTSAPQAPVSAPNQAPPQPVMQQINQSLSHALAEMNLPPTSQNMQIAQSLLQYGLPVNQQSMQFVQHTLTQMSDKSAATIEAIAALMINEKALTPETVRAMKQLMNGQALPEQLQHLQKELNQLVQQLRSPQAQAQLQQEMKLSQHILQQAATSSVVQQSAGQAQASEHRVDNQLKSSNQTTAEKVHLAEKNSQHLNVREQQQGKSELPAITHQQGTQRELESLYLQLPQGDPQEEWMHLHNQRLNQVQLDQLNKVFIRQLAELSQLLEQLNQHIVLRNYNQLASQQGQLVQLVGILQYKLNEFREMFKKLFPDLAYKALESVDLAGMDMFSRLAHLIDEGNDILRAQLKYAAQGLTPEQLQSAIRGALENIGVAIETLNAHLAARETLVPAQQALVIPFAVSANGELYPAELKIEHDQERSRDKDGELPVKISLTLETHYLGRVGVGLSVLKKDLSLHMNVVTRRVKLLMESRLEQLQRKLEKESFQVSYMSCKVEPDLETRQSMLLPQRQPIRTLKRVEGVV